MILLPAIAGLNSKEAAVESIGTWPIVSNGYRSIGELSLVVHADVRQTEAEVLVASAVDSCSDDHGVLN